MNRESAQDMLLRFRLHTNLRKLRQFNLMTQDDIADIMQVTRALYNSWEAGRSLPSIEQLQRLAQLFKCSVDYLLTEHSMGTELNCELYYNTHKNDEDKDYVINDLSHDEKLLMLKYRLLSEEDKEKIRAYVEEVRDVPDELPDVDESAEHDDYFI